MRLYKVKFVFSPKLPDDYGLLIYIQSVRTKLYVKSIGVNRMLKTHQHESLL